jgi:hypothetical protein
MRLAPRRIVRLLERNRRRRSAVHNEYVKPAEDSDRAVNEGGDIRGRSEIGWHYSSRSDLGGGSCEPIRVARRDHHAGSLGSERCRASATEALTCRRD